jgi:hypothetical protein
LDEASQEELDLNIELASPDDFVPAPSDWRVVEVHAILAAFEESVPRLLRYPSVHAGAFRGKVDAYVRRRKENEPS